MPDKFEIIQRKDVRIWIGAQSIELKTARGEYVTLTRAELDMIIRTQSSLVEAESFDW